jgi:hypothetical protein
MKQPVGKYFASLSIIAAALTFSVPAANAELITGNLKIAGVGQVAISTGLIDFQPTGVEGGATGLARVVEGSTGSFASLVGTTVDLHDITSAAVQVGQPNQNFTFVTAFAGHSWTVVLDQLDEGVFAANPATNCPGLPAAAGQVCTPSIGPVKNPFSFLNTSPNSSTVSVTFTGRAIDNDNPQDVTAVRGVVGATFSEDNFQSLLAQASNGATITTSYSGTITAVPEPSTATMLIGALLVAGMVAGRRLVG